MRVLRPLTLVLFIFGLSAVASAARAVGEVSAQADGQMGEAGGSLEAHMARRRRMLNAVKDGEVSDHAARVPLHAFTNMHIHHSQRHVHVGMEKPLSRPVGGSFSGSTVTSQLRLGPPNHCESLRTAAYPCRHNAFDKHLASCYR
jgi:hypothetical protein